MTEPTGDPVEGIRLYRAFGDELPPADDLRDIYTQLNTNGQEHLIVLLVKSQVCIDLARVEPEHALTWLASSETALNEVDRQAAIEQNQEGHRSILSHVARAALRRVELPNWRCALEGLPTPNNYPDLLDTASALLPLVGQEVSSQNDDGVKTALIEITPLILGLRLDWRNQPGWLGRLGLLREESRQPLPRPRYNPNWDTGVCFDDRPESFLNPTIKLALMEAAGGSTKKPQKKPNSYRAAGVVPISAAHFQFRDPVPVIRSCVEELECDGNLSVRAARRQSLMSSGYLDHITNSLRGRVRRPLRRGRADNG